MQSPSEAGQEAAEGELEPPSGFRCDANPHPSGRSPTPVSVNLGVTEAQNSQRLKAQVVKWSCSAHTWLSRQPSFQRPPGPKQAARPVTLRVTLSPSKSHCPFHGDGLGPYQSKLN